MRSLSLATFSLAATLKVKLSPKCSLSIFCECKCVRPLCKSIITTKEALLRFTVVSFSGQAHFLSARGTLTIASKLRFLTLRRLDTTWNFARSITRLSTHKHEHWEHCLCTQSSLKRMFLDNSHYQTLVPLAAVLPVTSADLRMWCNLEVS